MKTNSLHKDLSVLLLSFLLALSSVQCSYQEQYKYSSIDLLFIPTDTTVECLVDPEQDHFRIRKILSSFDESNTNPAKQVSSNPYQHKNIFQHYFLQVKVINSPTLLVSTDMVLFHPFISVLQKSQPSHSSEEDGPFPINC